MAASSLGFCTGGSGIFLTGGFNPAGEGRTEEVEGIVDGDGVRGAAGLAVSAFGCCTGGSRTFFVGTAE